MRSKGVLQAQIELQVQFYDVDMMEIVWHGHYVKYFEQARCALLDKLDHNYRQMRDSGYAWPVIQFSPVTFRDTANGGRVEMDALEVGFSPFRALIGQPGATVTVVGYPNRNKPEEMRAERILINGKTIELR